MPGKTGNRSIAGKIGLGIFTALAVLFLLLCILSALMQKGSIPQETVFLSLAVSLLIASSAGCMIAAKGAGTNRMITALVPAAALVVLMLTGRWLTPAGQGTDTVIWPFLIAALLPGCCLGLRRRKKKRR
jgi:putative membrane protein (TIGR04086 family)